MYPEAFVAPMRKELSDVGILELHTPEEVVKALDNKSGTLLLVVNSVCGCAAGGARPGVISALNQPTRPDRIVSVFAGVDKEATQKAREYLMPFPPSSPAIALFKDGQLVHILERHHIERSTVQMITENLIAAFEKHCR
ncbi:MAG: BrxA/BrxB family bacilliredoxin [Bacteroidia bacterium]|nr:BrxA/BrxB family bacilliredoxin [Bacteroidia bacterium]